MFTIEDCIDILKNVTVNDIIVSQHFSKRLKGRSLDITSYLKELINQKNMEVTYAKGRNRFMIKYYCESINKIITIIIHIQDNKQVVLITIY